VQVETEMAMEYDQKAAGKVHHAAVSRDYISQPRLSMYKWCPHMWTLRIKGLT